MTQAFNTTNSMGRLTLNVLLSFAQFEREVTGERIRDKIAASKKKGLWMGGPVPLGYQVMDRKLVPVPEEAERVRTIKRRYIASNSANELIEELKTEGIRTKIQRRTSGPHRGGIPFRRGSLFHLLKNTIYRGKIVHKDKAYDGQHKAIVDEALWEGVQARLKQKAPPRKRTTNDPQQAMLRGRLTDSEGRSMVPTYVTKGSRRYVYYETRKDLAKAGGPPATRWSRGALEKHIVTSLSDLLGYEHALRRLTNIQDAGQLTALFEAADLRRTELGNPAPRETAMRSIGQAIQCKDDRFEILIHPRAMGIALKVPLHWSIPVPSRKPKLRIDPAGRQNRPDQQLVQLLVDAVEAKRLVLCSPELSLNPIGKREGRCKTQLAKLLRLSWLSPRIVEAILSGTQPSTPKRAQLLNCELPLGWNAQERLLGFAR